MDSIITSQIQAFYANKTLIINDLHQGNTNPTLEIRTDALPLQNSTTLGTDESGTKLLGPPLHQHLRPNAF